MTTLYCSFNDNEAKWTADVKEILYYELSARTGEQLIEIVNEYRGSNDNRTLYVLADIDSLFSYNTPLEVLKACKYIDLDAPFFEYDGTEVTSIDDVYDYLDYNEFCAIVDWLADNDRWEEYEELAHVIQTKEEND